VREKKQKACANCRRAKLKCIVENNQTDCVRCRARKERCVFYPRGHVSRRVYGSRPPVTAISGRSPHHEPPHNARCHSPA
jgi:hypothetical protein